MKKEKKFVIKIYLVSFALALASVFVQRIIHDDTILLFTRLAGLAFFLGFYFWVIKKVKETEKIVKQSDGFIQQPFDPKILILTMRLFLVGWAFFTIADYLHVNFIEWIYLYTLAIILVPISQGLLPLVLRDNKWRK